MATRRERVVLELEDDFTPGMARSAAATALLNRELNSLSGQSVQTARSQRDVDTSIAGTTKSAGSGEKAIDKYSGRLRLLADLAITLGPGLVPIASVGIPAVSGLAASLGFAAVAGGVVATAMYGVGDALKALNKYALEPTDANLQKVNQTLGKLAPDAQAFVLRLRDMGPALAKLRDAGAEQLFPYWATALDDVERMLPRVQRIISRVADEVGQITEDGADSLAGPRWADFLDFLQKETPPAIEALATSTGSLAHAATELWMAFDPLNDDFLGWLVNATARLDESAGNLEGSEGLEHLIDYIEQNGPQVAATLGAIGTALLDVVEAGAPLGGPVLQALEIFANIVSAIADSDIGTPLFAGIAAMSALNRAQALFKTSRDSAFGQKAIGQVRGYADSLLHVTSAQERASLSSKELAKQDAARYRTIAKGAGALAGIGLIVSGYADKAGYGTAATLGLTGAMVGGVPGAIAGGLIGAGLDIKSSLDQASDGVARWREETAAAVASGDVVALQKTVSEASSAYQAYADDLANNTFTSQVFRLFDPQDLAQDWSELDGGSTVLSRLHDQAQASQEALYSLQGGILTLARVMGDEGANNADLWNRTLARAQPAMEALGISVQDLSEAEADGTIVELSRRIEDWTQHADSAEGRTEAVADAIADLGDKAVSTSDKADALKASLDELLGPQLDLSAATDAWRVGLRELNHDLSEHGRRLRGFTVDATENRAVIRGRVTDLTSVLVADAKAGASAEDLAKKIRNNRKALLDQGEAAGLSRKALGSYLDTLGLTPDLVQTVLKLVGDLESQGKAKDTKKEYDKLKPPVQTEIRADNHQAIAAARAAQAALDNIDRLIQVRILVNETKLSNGGKTPPSGGGGGGGGDDGDGLMAASSRLIDSIIYPGRSAPKKQAPDLPKIFDTVLGQLAAVFDDRGKKLTKAFNQFDPAINKGADQVRAEVQELRKAVHEAGHQWTDAMDEEAKRLIALAEKRDTQKAIGKALRQFDVAVGDGADGVRSEVHELKKAIREAGGVWTDALQGQADKLIETATAYDAQLASLQDLQAQRDQFQSSVATSFNTDVLGGNLADLDRGLTGDVNGIAAMQQVLAALAAAGLDTTGDRGGLYADIAKSGNLSLAQQLLASGAGGIDYYEGLFAQRATDQQAFGTGQADTVFAQAIADSNAVLQQLAGKLDRQEAALDRMTAAAEHLPSKVGDAAEKGTYQGAKEGIKDVASGAGRDRGRNDR